MDADGDGRGPVGDEVDGDVAGRAAPRLIAPDFILQRVAVRPEGAFGVLLQTVGPKDNIGVPFAVTLERTYDHPNGRQMVKIPIGRWGCARTHFHRGGYDTYEIIVPGHTRLLFHKGNVEAHSDGCVLVGESFTEVGVAASAVGLAQFLSRVGGRAEFELEVRG